MHATIRVLIVYMSYNNCVDDKYMVRYPYNNRNTYFYNRHTRKNH